MTSVLHQNSDVRPSSGLLKVLVSQEQIFLVSVMLIFPINSDKRSDNYFWRIGRDDEDPSVTSTLTCWAEI